MACTILSACAARSRSSVALDHVLIFVRAGAPERVALEAAGFTIAPTVNRHDGQGTASITVELLNFFLELIWVDSTVPVSPGRELVRSSFAKRADWPHTGWSPFGLALHRTSSAKDSFPVEARKVQEEWMEPGTAMYILGSPTDTLAPRVSVHPKAVDERANLRTLNSSPATLFTHRNDIRRLTSVDRIVVSSNAFTATMHMLDSLGIARFERGSEPLIELSFDNRRQGLRKDLRPGLPIIIRY